MVQHLSQPFRPFDCCATRVIDCVLMLIKAKCRKLTTSLCFLLLLPHRESKWQSEFVRSTSEVRRHTIAAAFCVSLSEQHSSVTVALNTHAHLTRPWCTASCERGQIWTLTLAPFNHPSPLHPFQKLDWAGNASLPWCVPHRTSLLLRTNVQCALLLMSL